MNTERSRYKKPSQYITMKKYCVIQMGTLSDLLQTKRLILSLCRGQAEVHLCVSAAFAAAASYLYPEVLLHAIDDSTEFVEDSVYTFFSETHFDAVYNLHDTTKSLMLVSMMSTNKKYGYWENQGRGFRSQWLTCNSRVHGRKRFLNTMDVWAHLVDHPVPSHTVNPIAMRKGGGIGVVLRDALDRTLPLDVLAGCINAVCSACREIDVVLFGESVDEPLVAELLPLLKSSIAAKTVTRCFDSAFEEDAGVIGGLDMLVTPESSLMHLAAHLGTPVNAFFHSSAWCMENGPYGLGHKIWQSDVSCAPCVPVKDCAENHICMHVFGEEKLQRFLAGKIDSEYPEFVTGYVSMLDEVGVTYMPVFGTEKHAEERLALRGISSEFLGITKISKTVPAGRDNFYAEQDWLMPNCLVAEGEEDA